MNIPFKYFRRGIPVIYDDLKYEFRHIKLKGRVGKYGVQRRNKASGDNDWENLTEYEHESSSQYHTVRRYGSFECDSEKHAKDILKYEINEALGRLTNELENAEWDKTITETDYDPKVYKAEFIRVAKIRAGLIIVCSALSFLMGALIF